MENGVPEGVRSDIRADVMPILEAARKAGWYFSTIHWESTSSRTVGLNAGHRLVGLSMTDAERELRRVLDLDPSYYLAHHFLDMLHLQRGNLPEALASAERAFALAPWVGWVRGFLAGILKLTGDAVRAESVLREMGSGTAYGAPFGLFCYHLLCSEIEQAADWVEKAIAQRDPVLLYPLRLPLTKDLRQSSRWPKLAKMMNLPDAV
jgi:tetratricopeptide (TPR) repeat protein